ncbi:hypothetical protein Bbelb_024170 [Branchiostoma belcheri]|nr:hypothetical protein Bbelb_024170 [Branchiostoma belcheri]
MEATRLQTSNPQPPHEFPLTCAEDLGLIEWPIQTPDDRLRRTFCLRAVQFISVSTQPVKGTWSRVLLVKAEHGGLASIQKCDYPRPKNRANPPRIAPIFLVKPWSTRPLDSALHSP